jgi:serine/threonine-protein kinase RsbT
MTSGDGRKLRGSTAADLPEAASEVPIDGEDAVLRARQAAREAAESLGFSVTDVTRIVTATSELARNVSKYAGTGVMRSRTLARGGQTGLELVFEDEGPGIEKPDAALRGEYSTSDGMGRGLSGTEELVDELDLETEPGVGTTITIRMWTR